MRPQTYCVANDDAWEARRVASRHSPGRAHGTLPTNTRLLKQLAAGASALAQDARNVTGSRGGGERFDK